MKIRTANKFDIPAIITMMKRYREHSPLPCLRDADNVPYIESIITHILAGRGIIFIAEWTDGPIGMLIALKNPNVWDPAILVMNELAYWVNQEHRGSSAGYRLLDAYRQHCQELVNTGEIRFFTISKMVNSPDLKYEKFGFEKLEEMWRSEECQPV
jgi:hypothetical protein